MNFPVQPGTAVIGRRAAATADEIPRKLRCVPVSDCPRDLFQTQVTLAEQFRGVPDPYLA
jgi:hypothetical protein